MKKPNYKKLENIEKLRKFLADKKKKNDNAKQSK